MADNTNTTASPTPALAPAAVSAHNEAIASADAPSTPRFQFDEHLWAWKASLRILTIILAIIGIGTLAWSATNAVKYPSDDWLDSSAIGACAIPLGVSVLFNIIVLVVLVIRKRPMHPGIPVGIDLVLWLGLLVSGLFSIGAALDAFYFSPDDRYYYGYDYSDGSSSYDSNDYYSNNDQGDYIYNKTTGTMVYQHGGAACKGWDSCAQRQAYVDNIAHRSTVEFVGAGATFVCLLLHFVLFVWACVDTSRRNRTKTSGKARLMAERIVQEMVERGQIAAPAPAALRQEGGGRNAQGRQPLLAPVGAHSASRGGSEEV